ncbi:hypothetical protein F4778DRAFT_775553 [Xylariomycetidae sp. FL2044]|nr:hypothetical protein F4778DRAFT_775553 [Xylariomycetidae sp. FL2044]
MYMRTYVLAAGAVVLGLPQVHSSPMPSETSDYLPVKVEEVVGGTLTWYTQVSSSVNQGTTAFSNAQLEPQACGTNEVHCSTYHIYDVPSCETLIASLKSASGEVDGVQAACISQNGNEADERQCCVSWSKVVPKLQIRNLSNAADDVLRGCGSGSSGLASNVDLQGTCVTECLSDRAPGCTD